MRTLSLYQMFLHLPPTGLKMTHDLLLLTEE